MTRDNIPGALRGAAALHEMLNLARDGGQVDDKAKVVEIFAANSEDIGHLLTFAISELAGVT